MRFRRCTEALGKYTAVVETPLGTLSAVYIPTRCYIYTLFQVPSIYYGTTRLVGLHENVALFHKYSSTAELPEGPPRLSTAYRPGTTDRMSTSGWARYPKNLTAFRGYGSGSLVLVKADNCWRLFDGDKNELALDAGHESSLEAIIETVDLLYPPEGWTRLDHSAWERGDWSVTLTQTGWKVGHPKAATRQVFPSADRARKWVDLRAARPNGTRGPRCRSTARANRTLPDVRVTEAERSEALELASDLKISFAELVRAALKTLINLRASGQIAYDPANHVISTTRPGCTCVARED